VLTEALDAFSQHYGFSTITITGLVLDARRQSKQKALASTAAEVEAHTSLGANS